MTDGRVLWALRLNKVKLPSGNDLTRGRWAESSWRKKFEKELTPLGWFRRLSHIDGSGRRRARPCPLAPKCQLQVTRILGPRERQYDQRNADAGVKPLEDALVLAGYLPADSPDWLSVLPTIQRRAENGEPAPAIAILITKR